MKCDVFWVSGFIVMTFSILSLAPKRNYRKILYQCQQPGVNIVVGFFFFIYGIAVQLHNCTVVLKLGRKVVNVLTYL